MCNHSEAPNFNAQGPGGPETADPRRGFRVAVCGTCGDYFEMEERTLGWPRTLSTREVDLMYPGAIGPTSDDARFIEAARTDRVSSDLYGMLLNDGFRVSVVRDDVRGQRFMMLTNPEQCVAVHREGDRWVAHVHRPEIGGWHTLDAWVATATAHDPRGFDWRKYHPGPFASSQVKRLVRDFDPNQLRAELDARDGRTTPAPNLQDPTPPFEQGSDGRGL